MPSSYRVHFLLLALLTVFSFVLYTEIFAYNTFGPEFPLFFYYNDGHTFTDMLRSYTYTSQMWYRPTSFALFYWIGEQFIHWHNLAGWKLFHFVTVLATAYGIYWLVARCLGSGATADFPASFTEKPDSSFSATSAAVARRR